MASFKIKQNNMSKQKVKTQLVTSATKLVKPTKPTKPSKPGGKPSYKVSREVSFISPNGRTFTTTNLSAFARRFNLDSSSLSKLINGTRTHFKNWTVKQVAA